MARVLTTTPMPKTELRALCQIYRDKSYHQHYFTRLQKLELYAPDLNLHTVSMSRTHGQLYQCLSLDTSAHQKNLARSRTGGFRGAGSLEFSQVQASANAR